MTATIAHTGRCIFTLVKAQAGRRFCAHKECDRSIVWPPEKPVPAVESSDTSKAAARAIEGGPRAKARLAVLNAIIAATEGLTAERISEITGISGDTVRPRIVELSEANLIMKSTRTRMTRAGREAQVWVVGVGRG